MPNFGTITPGRGLVNESCVGSGAPMSAFAPTPVADPRIQALPPASNAVIPAFHFGTSVHRIVRCVLDTNRVGLGVNIVHLGTTPKFPKQIGVIFQG